MKRIKIVPYGCILHLTNSKEEWLRKYKKLTGQSYDADGCDGLTYDHGDANFYVGVFNGEMGTLAHELGHVCLDVAERVQLGDIIQEQEQFCYLLGYLTEQSIKTLDKMKGTNNVSSCS